MGVVIDGGSEMIAEEAVFKNFEVKLIIKGDFMMGRKTKQATFILVLSTIFVLMFFCSNQNFVMAEEKNLQPHLHNVYTLKFHRKLYLPVLCKSNREIP